MLSLCRQTSPGLEMCLNSATGPVAGQITPLVCQSTWPQLCQREGLNSAIPVFTSVYIVDMDYKKGL